jgi:hypothetical protein
MTNRITGEELKWVGIDFDDTIANNSGFPDFTPTTLLPDAREGINGIIANGFKPVIFTARTWAEYNIVEDFVKQHNLPIAKIICGKPLFRCMIDDRNIEFDGDWGKALAKVK